MPYLNLDDGYADHPKHENLSDGAFRLLTAALCYCAKHNTDGKVAHHKIRILIPKFKPSYVTELLSSHPERPDIIEIPEGYYVRDYLQWNRSKAEVDEAKEKNRKRQQAWRESHRNEDGTYHD